MSLDAISLLLEPLYFIPLCFVVGSLIGSFLNVVAYRMPIIIRQGIGSDLNLSFPLSFCPACEHRIRPHENIPMLSFLFLRGRCSCCNTRIPARYFVVELFTAVATALVAFWFGPTVFTVLYMLLLWFSIAMFLAAYDMMTIPVPFSVVFLEAGLLASLIGFSATPLEALAGSILGYAGGLLICRIPVRFQVLPDSPPVRLALRQHEISLLLAACGAWVGYQVLLLLLIAVLFVLVSDLMGRQGAPRHRLPVFALAYVIPTQTLLLYTPH